MKCDSCNCELEYICDLTQEEILDVDFIKTKYEILDNEIDNLPNNVNQFNNSEQLSEYIHAVYNQVANNKTLDFITYAKILKNHNLDNSTAYSFINGKIWKHPNN